jgi:hypothetical protein
MATITIPKKITKGEELVIIPRKEYEEFSKWQVFLKSFRIFAPTSAQKKDLERARQDYKKRKYISINELKHKLAIKDTG